MEASCSSGDGSAAKGCVLASKSVYTLLDGGVLWPVHPACPCLYNLLSHRAG